VTLSRTLRGRWMDGSMDVDGSQRTGIDRHRGTDRDADVAGTPSDPPEQTVQRDQHVAGAQGGAELGVSHQVGKQHRDLLVLSEILQVPRTDAGGARATGEADARPGPRVGRGATLAETGARRGDRGPGRRRGLEAASVKDGHALAPAPESRQGRGGVAPGVSPGAPPQGPLGVTSAAAVGHVGASARPEPAPRAPVARGRVSPHALDPARAPRDAARRRAAPEEVAAPARGGRRGRPHPRAGLERPAAPRRGRRPRPRQRRRWPAAARGRRGRHRDGGARSRSRFRRPRSDPPRCPRGRRGLVDGDEAGGQTAPAKGPIAAAPPAPLGTRVERGTGALGDGEVGGRGGDGKGGSGGKGGGPRRLAGGPEPRRPRDAAVRGRGQRG